MPFNADNYDAVNNALAECEPTIRIRVRRLVGSFAGGNYTTVRYETSRGGHVMIKFVEPGREGTVCIKSVCSIPNKRSRASMLVNGQACTNTIDKVWYFDGDGPVISKL